MIAGLVKIPKQNLNYFFICIIQIILYKIYLLVVNRIYAILYKFILTCKKS